jgi:riboflavin kinase/FMN adenylyltransferase
VTGASGAASLHDLAPIGPAAITIGVFDGVHLGHRAVLEATRTAAAERSARSVALVFDPHPDEVLRPATRVPRLAPPVVNMARMTDLGIDRVQPLRFDEELRSLTAEAFLAALAPSIELRSLVMASHSAFGRDRAGTLERMRQLGGTRGFDVVAVDPVEDEGGGGIVSSTRVRAAISAGDVATALRLGVAPYLEGVVVAGDRRGRALGFPTANLRLDYEAALPALGIYAGRVSRGGPAGRPALISVGTRPTFEEHGRVVIEAYLLDFEGDLYGTLLGVELAARLRDELRFEDVSALVDQMRLDERAARALLEIP